MHKKPAPIGFVTLARFEHPFFANFTHAPVSELCALRSVPSQSKSRRAVGTRVARAPLTVPACSIPAPGSSTQHVVFALRKVCRCWSVILTAPVAYGGFAELLAPSPVSAPTRRDCHGLVLTNPTPGPARRRFLSLRLSSCWPSQLVRQGPSGSPIRLHVCRPSTRATLLDSGRPPDLTCCGRTGVGLRHFDIVPTGIYSFEADS